MVSTELKDQVLRSLVEDYPIGTAITIYTKNNTFGIELGVLLLIMNQLRDLNFFEQVDADHA